jgi:hypothetical protein
MENYRIIHFESVPQRIKKTNDTFFNPNSKYWNKLFLICDTYVKSNFYLKDNNLDTEVYKSEMNKPIILRNCGLNYMKGLRLEKLEFVETDFIFPSGIMVSKKAEVYYNMVSKKYVMLSYNKEKNIENITIIKHSRLDAYLKGNNVKKYELKINNDNYKVVIED